MSAPSRTMSLCAERSVKLALMAASAFTLLAGAAAARTNDPNYLAYDGGAELLPPLESGTSQPFVNAQPLFAAPGSTSVGLSFQGISQYDTRAINGGFSFIPPDTMGAVGASQFMETSNGAIAVYSKSTGALQSMISDGAFWTAAGQVQGTYPNGLPQGNGDSRVLFDSTSQRWIVESFGMSLSDIQIAVSNTSDALGGWQSTKFTGYAGGIADYPTLAIDGQAVYIGTNDFSSAGNYQGETLNVISRANLFGPGAPTTASLKQFFTPLSAIIGGADPGFAIQGVNQVGGSDAGKIVSVSIQGPDIVRYNVNSPGTAGASLTPTVDLHLQTYFANNPGAQPGDASIGGPVIDTLDDRISSAAWEENGRIYTLHTVTLFHSQHTQVAWTVVDAATNHVIQQGAIADPNYDIYQGAITISSSGLVVIEYNRSGTDPATGNISVLAQGFGTTHAGALYRIGTADILHVSPTSTYHNGSLDGQPAVGRQRWGDYAQVTVDPNNPDSFWVIGQFAREPNDAANGHPGGTGGTRWGTWIADLNLTAPTVPEPATWAMMLAGFGLVGGAIRRQSRKTAASLA
jgi:PEP-CTERM motif